MGNNDTPLTLGLALKCLGRPMTYYPSLARLLGIKESIFLCQLIYWTPRAKQTKGDGWIYKSVEELEEETGLSYKEQKRIRASLLKQELLEEEYNRTEHLLYFRVNSEIFNQKTGHITNGQMPPKHIPNGQVAPDQRADGICPKVSSYKEAEITTEITPESTNTKPSPSEGKDSDQRHTAFRALIEKAQHYKTKQAIRWGPAAAMQLKRFLVNHPKVDEEGFKQILRHYWSSQNINPSSLPEKYLPRLDDYVLGPLNQFGHPLGGSHGKQQNRGDARKQSNAAAIVAGMVGSRIKAPIGDRFDDEQRSGAGGGGGVERLPLALPGSSD